MKYKYLEMINNNIIIDRTIPYQFIGQYHFDCDNMRTMIKDAQFDFSIFSILHDVRIT